MPPKKRQRSASPAASKPQSSSKTPAAKRIKKEPGVKSNAATARGRPSVEENKAFLSEKDGGTSDSASDSSDDDQDGLDFEDAMPHSTPAIRKRQGKATPAKAHHNKQSVSDEDSEGDSDDDMHWEDATKHPSDGMTTEPTVSGDLELTLDELPTQSLGAAYGAKKGPSKIERMIRLSTHCLHVQCLMYHNLTRNGWACDKEVQKALKSTIPGSILKEIERWRRACGDTQGNEDEEEAKVDKADEQTTKGKYRKNKKKDEKGHRDWGKAAKELGSGGPSLNQSDATVKLLKALTAWWRKRFTITAPGLRKEGWKDAARLEKDVKGFREQGHNMDDHGERIQSLKDFRKLAQKCEGSRDVGAQLFVALLRNLGLETRLVSSLQPIGFGWGKFEDALPPSGKSKKTTPAKSEPAKNKKAMPPTNFEQTSPPPEPEFEEPQPKRRKTIAHTAKAAKRQSISAGAKDEPINLADDSGLSDAPDSDHESLIDITPPMPSTSVQKYDRDLEYPTYWAEVLSPASQTWIPVDPIVLNLVATNDDAMPAFEPRGAKADKARQVFAYVVAFNSDGTAKDVTVRYLKRHMFPGKTKGVRVLVEKIPVLNRRGKVLRHRQYDWFGHVMSIYERPVKKRTAADDIEDQRELKPVKPEKTAKEEGNDTLQGLKSSAEFVLERHLRREEAMKPGATQVRRFTIGKGDKATEEPIFRREDIIVGKTVETWHKEGREIVEGAQPIKYVPFRAVTTTRKRELEEAERATGEKQKQSLYDKTQTKWIIPPPIGPDRSIPKNSYGNMDVYVPTMVPKGAVHIPLRGTAKVCKQLNIDHAEACTGFEFGHRMAIPILTGVVVAIENEHTVIDAWEVQEATKREKERVKREKLALGKWRTFLNKLRIVKNLRERYGEEADKHFEDELKNLTGKKGAAGKKAEPKKGKPKKKEVTKDATDEDDCDSDEEGTTIGFFGTGGGFLPEGMDIEEPVNRAGTGDAGGGGGGGFMLDGAADDDDAGVSFPQTPVSLNSVDQDLEDDQDDSLSDAPSSDDDPIPTKKKSSGKQRSAKVPQRSARKSTVRITPPDSTEDLDEGDGHTGNVKKRGSTKRGAARKSAEAVRSHYFDDDGSADG